MKRLELARIAPGQNGGPPPPAQLADDELAGVPVGPITVAVRAAEVAASVWRDADVDVITAVIFCSPAWPLRTRPRCRILSVARPFDRRTPGSTRGGVPHDLERSQH